MTDIVKAFLQDIFIKVYNEDGILWWQLAKEENILFMHEHLFGKMYSFMDIYKCAKIIGDNEEATRITDQFIIDSNKIENMFYKIQRLLKQMKGV